VPESLHERLLVGVLRPEAATRVTMASLGDRNRCTPCPSVEMAEGEESLSIPVDYWPQTA
jgi:hypothetical protein